MLKKALKDICTISNDEEINTRNYLDSIDYIDNLYHAVGILKQNVSIKKLTFYPTFKSKYICEKLGIPSFPEENELRLIKVSSEIFREDKKTTMQIMEKLKNICYEITLVDSKFVSRINHLSNNGTRRVASSRVSAI